MHLDQIAQDPTRQKQYKAMEATWKNLAVFTNQLHGQVQKMMKEQQAQQQKTNGAASDEQLAQMKVEAELSRKERKLQVDLNSKQAKTAQQLQIADSKARQSEAINDVTTANDIIRKDAEAKAKAKAQTAVGNKK
jgi:hypothetical protein